ncbi:transglutaminase domain-containing protein [Demequina aurantiaca]|uniref:transglutaminase domain-containing protein n=1 Tax=Demequina aurantiaca TaxID=676200 RepID=UPI003D33BD24
MTFQPSRARSPRLPPAGWMPDPSETDLERYWDGSRWSARTRNRYTRLETGVVPAAHTPYQSSYASQYSYVSHSAPRRRGRGIFVTLAIVAVIAGAYVYADRAGVAPSVSEVASALAEAAKPDDAQVDFPVFGSTELVNHLERAMIAQQSSIDVTYWARTGGVDSVADAMSEAMIQNPYVYAGSYSYRDDTGTVVVEPTYPYDREEGDRRRVATRSAVTVGVERSGALDTTDQATQVARIHDYIVSAGTYDYAAFDEINAGQYTDRVQQSQEAYGLLVEGTAVCNGYAQSFNAMAQEVGLRSVEVTGSDSSGATGGSHAWNKVLIGGEWLLVDTTWDDSGDQLRSDYLLLGADAPILATRTQDSEWVVDANIYSFVS